MTSVLFVCLGNICRSPLAEGLFRHHVTQRGLSDRFVIDSAGTGGWHEGEGPDRRSVAVAARYGVDISSQTARKLRPEDFDRFDLILGLDRQNVIDISRLHRPDHPSRIALYLEEALGEKRDVPDPYYGDNRDFEAVYKLCDQASQKLIERLGW
ncbi:MAG: low molecular weight protein-tyrosine-phosphatase [Asticcacaulis sp.]